MTKDPQKVSEQPKVSRVGFDNLLDDLFGLNFRALLTIWILFKSPIEYFKAAQTPEWMNKYTPSFRVWIGLMAATAALKFLYTDDTSAMVSMYKDMFGQIETQMNSGVSENTRHVIDADIAAKSMLKWIFAIYPFTYIPIIALVAIFYRAWTIPLSYVVRLRCLFGIVIPGMFISLAATLFVTVLDANTFAAFSVVTLLLVFTFDVTTAFRGPYSHVKGAARWGRSLGVSLILFVVYLLASTVATIPAMAIALQAASV